MGTEITLSIDGIDVSYSKSHIGMDHGSLFQKSDRKRMRSDQINYDYFESHDDPEILKMEMGFSKPLRDVVPRIELLGFTINAIRCEYESCVLNCGEDRSDREEYRLEKAVSCMSFDQFLEIVSSINISSLNHTYDEQCLEKDPAIYGSKFVDASTLKTIPFYCSYDIQAYSEQSFLAGVLGFLHPYSALRLLAENEHNLDQDVKWQYGPLVNNGWANESEFLESSRRIEKFLIVTEGHTDASILDLAIRTIRPEIEDFFSFIDMSEGHPFGGTGNLQKFAKGLAQMDVQNQTLFLYDNDTEGLSAFRNTKKLNLPINMSVAMLPDHESFESFQTLGPTGKEKIDINGKAVAIECYLDLFRPELPNEPLVQWSGYKADVKQYQGALAKKEKYTKDFLENTPDDLLNTGYDLSKLGKVVDTIYKECVILAVNRRKAS